MSKKKLSRNARCPCDSGLKYKACCYNKGFHYVVDDSGAISRSVPLNEEAVALLEQQRERFIAKHGRPPGPNDPIFDPEELPDKDTLASDMKLAGIHPALVHAFQKTGLLLTKENRHLMPTSYVKEFQDAVDEYYALHPEADEALDS